MKIFLYAQGRSGSNTILHTLKDVLNIKHVWEEKFNREIIDHQLFESRTQEDNIIVKFHPGQRTSKFSTDIDFLRYIDNNFDHLLFHARANCYETALSIENGLVNKNQSWISNKYDSTVTRPLLGHVEHASTKLTDLLSYSRSLGKDLTFYEEIFSDNPGLVINTVKRWRIDSNLLSYDILLEQFDSKGKYTNNIKQ